MKKKSKFVVCLFVLNLIQLKFNLVFFIFSWPLFSFVNKLVIVQQLNISSHHNVSEQSQTSNYV